MKRGLLTYMILLVSCGCVWGREIRSETPRITFGAEWGYMPALFSGHHFNFFAPEGFRVDDKGVSAIYRTNGEVSLHVGYNINSLWNISIHAGYSGAGTYEPVIPISCRFTRFWGDNYMLDRWFTLLDIGSGICLKESPQEIVTGKIGGGYRISLSRNTKLDFIAAIRMLYTHPDIIYYKESIDINHINRNDGYIGSIFLGISLTF